MGFGFTNCYNLVYSATNNSSNKFYVVGIRGFYFELQDLSLIVKFDSSSAGFDVHYQECHLLTICIIICAFLFGDLPFSSNDLFGAMQIFSGE